MVLLWVGIGFAVAAAYALVIRPALQASTHPWAVRYFELVEPIERLWLKSETILMARAKILTGLLLTFLTQMQYVDITPLMPLVPDDWEPAVKVAWNMLPMSLTVLGWMDEHLRKVTTQPIEVVALPEAKKQDPMVAAAVAELEVAKETAKIVAVEATKGG